MPAYTCLRRVLISNVKAEKREREESKRVRVKWEC